MKKRKKIILLCLVAAVLLLGLPAASWVKKTMHREPEQTLTEYLADLKESGKEPEPVTVAVIDSGFGTGKEEEGELSAGRLSPLSRSFTEDPEEAYADGYGHGTQIASLLLHNTEEPVELMVLKVTDGEGEACVDAVCEALEYAAANGADIVNLSMNAVMTGTQNRLGEQIEEMTGQGISVVVSAGNGGSNTANLTPADTQAAIVVGAAQEDGTPSSFSGYGKTVDFCSYESYAGEQGTSFSAAYVTAALASLRSYGLDSREAHKVLQETAEPYAGKQEKRYGTGYVFADTFDRGRKEEAAGLQLVGTQKSEADLGAAILDLKWKRLSQEELDSVLADTDKAYVGAFLDSLTPKEWKKLEEKSSLLHAEVLSSDYVYEEETRSYVLSGQESVDFAAYCKARYEENRGRMCVSSKWLSKNDETVFYISSASSETDRTRTSKYKYVITGLLGKGADQYSLPDALQSARFPEPISGNPNANSDVLFAPNIQRFQLYFTDVTARHTYATEMGAGAAWDGYYPLYNLNVYEDNTRRNGADNGLAFYGISIYFDNTYCTRTGYRYRGSEVEAIKQGTFADPAKHRGYTQMGENGFEYRDYINEQAFEQYDIQCLFKKLSPPLHFVSFQGTYEESYDNNYAYTPYDVQRDAFGNPVAIREKDRQEVEEHYIRTEYNNAYLMTNEDSFDNRTGTMTLNSHFYAFSGMTYVEDEGAHGGWTVIINDTIDYVIKPSPINYTVRYHSNDGTDSYQDQLCTYDVSSTTLGGVFSAYGYRMTGWNTSPDGTGTGYGLEEAFSNLTSVDGAVIDLYAQWESTSFQVKLDANGGTLYDFWTNTAGQGTMTFPVTVNDAYGWAIGGAAPAKTGYHPEGWYVDTADPDNTAGQGVAKTGGTKVWKADGTCVSGAFWDREGVLSTLTAGLWKYAGNVTAFVHWTPNSYTVKFDGNGATSGSMNPLSCVYGTAFDLSPNGFGKTGYTFDKWNTKADGTGVTYAGGQTGLVNLTDTDGGEVTLYAQWKANRYTVKFDGNGATSGSMNPLSCVYGTAFDLPVNTFQKTGYVFKGWKRTAGGTAAQYSDRQTGLVNLTDAAGGEVILYAHWKDEAPPQITPPSQPDVPPLSPESTADHLVYGWTNRNIFLNFTASDSGSGMDSLTLYEGQTTTGSVLASGRDAVSYTASQDGIFHYTLVAKDISGNTKILTITTKIDHVTPRGDMAVDYDGYHLGVRIENIVEENRQHPDNYASGCKEAWVVIRGLDAQGNELCSRQEALSLTTPGNLFTGAAFAGAWDLEDSFNYDSDTLEITAYVKDIAGNYLPAQGTQTLPAFRLTGYVERCLGWADKWKAGEAGNVCFTTGAFVDEVWLEYPQEWIERDESLAADERTYDYAGNQELEKSGEDLFFIPVYAENDAYTVTVHAYKNGREKTVDLPVVTDGTILDEIRTRLR